MKIYKKNIHPLKISVSDYETLEEHYHNDKLYSILIFYKPDNLFCFIVYTLSDEFLYFWFSKRSYISLYHSSLITPHSSDYYKKHFPLNLLSYCVALQNRPYYMKGGQK